MTEEIQLRLADYVRTLPECKQRRFNEGLQRDLCVSLADSSIVLKAKELLADQHKNEKRLYDEREVELRRWQGHPALERKLIENDSKILRIMDEVGKKKLGFSSRFVNDNKPFYMD